MIEILALAAALVAGFAATLFLFVQLKREIAAGGAKTARRIDAVNNDLSTRVEALERRCRELESVTQTFVPPLPPPSGLNLSKRAQALQMHRRGEAAGTIAAALALPRNEVDLLLTVHGIVMDAQGPGAGGQN